MWRWREQKGILVAVIVVRRVRVRWGAEARGSTHANLRSAVPEAYALPQMPRDEGFVVHEILADAAVGCQPTVQTCWGVEAPRTGGLQIEPADNGVVERLPGWDVYDVPRWQCPSEHRWPGEDRLWRAAIDITLDAAAAGPADMNSDGAAR
jgi:hypothetical protein